MSQTLQSTFVVVNEANCLNRLVSCDNCRQNIKQLFREIAMVGIEHQDKMDQFNRETATNMMDRVARYLKGLNQLDRYFLEQCVKLSIIEKAKNLLHKIECDLYYRFY